MTKMTVELNEDEIRAAIADYVKSNPDLPVHARVDKSDVTFQIQAPYSSGDPRENTSGGLTGATIKVTTERPDDYFKD